MPDFTGPGSAPVSGAVLDFPPKTPDPVGGTPTGARGTRALPGPAPTQQPAGLWVKFPRLILFFKSEIGRNKTQKSQKRRFGSALFCDSLRSFSACLILANKLEPSHPLKIVRNPDLGSSLFSVGARARRNLHVAEARSAFVRRSADYEMTPSFRYAVDQ